MISPDNTQHSQQTNINVPAGFEPAIPAIERPQTHALDRAAAGTDLTYITYIVLTEIVILTVMK